MNEPVETSELLAFVRTVEARSLSRAAAELGAPRATISRRLARLEQRLGARLLRRTTRSLSLTDAGKAFLVHARSALASVQQAEESVRRADGVVRGDLRVSVPPMISARFFAMVTEFATRFPDVKVHVSFSSAVVDLRREAWDVALRAGTRIEPGLVARTLARSRVLAFASPAYLAQHGAPRTRRDLRRHRLLLGYTKDGLPQTHWPTKSGSQQVEGRFFSNDMHMLTAAACAGMGIAMLPLMYARAPMEEGQLVQVLPGILEADSQVAAVYAERDFVPPQVRRFIDALVAWAPSEFEGALGPRRARKSR